LVIRKDRIFYGENIMMYRKKPVVIEARKLTETNAIELVKWCDGFIHYPEEHNFDITIVIDTLEGAMSA
jgi:hypothetical protein